MDARDTDETDDAESAPLGARCRALIMHIMSSTRKCRPRGADFAPSQVLAIVRSGARPTSAARTAVRVDVGGEFQNTSCAPAYGGAVTFDIVAKVRNTPYVWSNPAWSTNYQINTGCGFNGRFDGVAGHWSWNKLNGG